MLQRELIEIEESEGQWLVKEVVAIHVFSTKAKAILEGRKLALHNFENTGRPIGIKVPVGWGETILIGAHS